MCHYYLLIFYRFFSVYQTTQYRNTLNEKNELEKTRMEQFQKEIEKAATESLAHKQQVMQTKLEIERYN